MLYIRLGCQDVTVRMLVTKENIFSLQDFKKELRIKVNKSIKLKLILPHSSKHLNRIQSKLVKKP